MTGILQITTESAAVRFSRSTTISVMPIRIFRPARPIRSPNSSAKTDSAHFFTPTRSRIHGEIGFSRPCPNTKKWIRSVRFDRDWKRLAIKLKRSYKFDIAAENARFYGYTTEKIMSSFMARTVPIYWGNPLIAEEFNPEAFVNANGMEAEELLETVRRIDDDDNLWCRMVSAPPMTPVHVSRSELDLKSYRQWTARVFGMNLDDAHRRPEGTWAEIYKNQFKTPLSRFVLNHNWAAFPGKIRSKATTIVSKFRFFD